MVSEVRYARSGDVHIAYQRDRRGPIRFVFVPGSASHVELAWEEPCSRAIYERIASFCAADPFDKRGTGMSDRVDAARPRSRSRMDDVRAVMDAVGSDARRLSRGSPRARR